MMQTCGNVLLDLGVRGKNGWPPCMDRRGRAHVTPTLRFASAPLGVVWRLAQQLPLATLHVVEDEDHGGADGTVELLVQATDRFAE